MKQLFVDIYTDWRDNWKSITAMAAHYKMDWVRLDRIVHIGRRIYRKRLTL